MSTAAHTPGPWKAEGDRVTVKNRYNVCPRVTAGGSAKGMIDEREIAAANARLIAAAPELLEALRDLSHEAFVAGLPMTHRSMKRALDVLNKATGTASEPT